MDGGSDADAPPSTSLGSPQRRKLPPPSTPTSSVRRKMASQLGSAGKDAVPPRRPTTTSGTATVGARRPVAAASTARPSMGASKPSSSSISRTGTVGSSLNKPPTRPAPGSAARRGGVAAKSTASDAEPELLSVTSGDENRKPAARRTTAMAGAAMRSPPGKVSSRSSLAPSSSTAAKRPLTTRPAAEASHSTTRASARSSLAASARTTDARPATTARAAPGAATRATIAHAKKLSVSTPSQDAKTQELGSPIDIPPRSGGPLKDKAASDAEVENRRIAIGSVKAALANLGEETPRPDTAPSGPAEMDFETKRRSAQIMQEFFQETIQREKLQEQCDDLNLEVDNLRSEKAKLKKQLLDAQAGITENGGAVNGTSNSAGFDQAAHTTLVDEMGRKFALETKQLEEQSQKLEVEKKAAQDREAEEARKAGELQQVLDDLNDELERQGREWDAEKKLIIQQTAEITDLREEVVTLREERDTLSREVADTEDAVNHLHSHVSELQQTQSNELQKRDEQISGLTKTVEQLRAEVEVSEQRHAEALQDAQRSLDAKLAEASTMVEELQSKVQSLQQQHTDELRSRDETISTHIKARDELHIDLSKLQERTDRTMADLESERKAHAEALERKVNELQRNADEELRVREEEVSSHLRSIDGLQEKIAQMQQGETDGAKLAEELHKQVGELEKSHEAALQAKTDENDELVQQLEAINDQLSTDAAELEQMKDEAEGLRRTISTLEQAGQQESSQHASSLAKVQAELTEARKNEKSYRAELEETRDKHQQEIRRLREDHDAKVDSLQADLKKDASNTMEKLQTAYNVLVVEKTALLEQHEKDQAKRDEEVQALRDELSTLEERSSSATQSLDNALAKHKQIEEEKADLKEAHVISEKLAAELRAWVDSLAKDAASHKELQARLASLTEEKTTAENAHAKSRTIITDLQARHDALIDEKAAAEELQARFVALMAEKSNADDAHAKSQTIITELQARHDALLTEKIEAEEGHARALEEFKQDSDSASKNLVNELQSKYDQLLREKESVDDAHAQSQTIVSNLQARHDSLLQEKTAAEDAHGRAIQALKEDSDNASKRLLEELQSKYDQLVEKQNSAESAHITELEDAQKQRDALSEQLSDLNTTHAGVLAEQAAAQEHLAKKFATEGEEIEERSASLLADLQSNVSTLEQEKATALSAKQSTLDELDTLRKELHAGNDAHKSSLDARDGSGSVGYTELQKQYEAILAERATAENDHEAAIAMLKEDLKEQHEHALSELRSEHAELKDKLAATDREHGDAIEYLKMEFKAGHSNDMQALIQQLETLQKQHADLTEQKASMDQAHEEAISELMVGMETSQSDAVQQLQKKYDDLVAQIDAAQPVNAARADGSVDERTQDTKRLEEALQRVTLERDEALAAVQEAESLRETVQALESGRERDAKIAASNDTHADDMKRLEDALQEIEAERDEAIAAAQEAEDQIETMKGEVVKKHLARVEPLEKANASLNDKIARLEAIIAAGDRVARAVATMGEQRSIDTLVEEDEEEDDNDEDATSGAQHFIPNPNGVQDDVIGTQLAAMQETLHQLSELNNDAIVESSRTAQRLTEQN